MTANIPVQCLCCTCSIDTAHLNIVPTVVDWPSMTMWVCIYVHGNMYAWVCIHVHGNMYAWVCMHGYVYMNIYTWVRILGYPCIHGYVCALLHIFSKCMPCAAPNLCSFFVLQAHLLYHYARHYKLNTCGMYAPDFEYRTCLATANAHQLRVKLSLELLRDMPPPPTAVAAAACCC